MLTIYIFLGIYLGVGFLYALWLWLFRYASFLSIIPNTLFGLPYILWTVYFAYSYRKFSFYELFKNKKAVIFDLDGTIIDSEPVWNTAVENIKNKVQLGSLTTEYPSGLNIRDKWLAIIKEAPAEMTFSLDKLISATKQEVLSTYTEVEAIDGFWRFVSYLKDKGYKIGLASNTDRDLVEEMIKRLEATTVFDVVLTGSDVKNKKPNPEIYKKALKELGVRASNTVAFEDTVLGSLSATSAGIDTVVIWNGNVEKTDYPRKIKTFISDFVNLDYDIEHSLKEKVEEAKKFVEENDIDISGETVSVAVESPELVTEPEFAPDIGEGASTSAETETEQG